MKSPNYLAKLLPRTAVITGTFVFLAIGHSLALAQTAPVAPTTSTAAKPEEEIVVLSPFVVDAGSDSGYAATSTLGGTRLKTELKDVASQVDIMTPEFLNDIGALTLEEALRYSTNIESSNEFLTNDDVNSINVFNSLNGSRTRGLTRSNNTHDFFETNFPIDTYNTGKRITFVSGSNAILFGAGLAGGTNDVSFERPDLRRTKGNITYRTDSNHGHRGSINVSVPLVKNHLAVRAATMKASEQDFRSGVGTDMERHYGSLIFQPHPKIYGRAWVEQNDIRYRQGVNTLTSDFVSRWIESGKPAFENLGVLSTSPAATYTTAYGPNASLTSYTPLNNSASGTGLETGNNYTNNVRVLSTYNANGSLSSTVLPQLWTYNTVNSLSHNSAFYGRDAATGGSLPVDVSRRLERSILDSALYPIDDSVVGDSQQRRLSGNVKGFLVEFNPIKNVYVEGGVNRENFDIESFAFLSGNDTDLKVDINRYLPNINPATGLQVLNPNFGKLYVEDDLSGSFWKNSRQDRRVQVAFSHDRAPRDSWRRWLGDHRGAIMLTESENKRAQHNGSTLPRIISNNVIPGITGAPAAQLLNAANDVNVNSRIARMRYYLDPANGSTSIQMPFDPWASDTFVMGKDANGADIVVSRGVDNPYGAVNAVSNGRKTDTAFQYALNSSFWNNRIITTFGKRSSDASFASWLPAAGQPRYNSLNGQYEVPVNGTFTSTGTAVPTNAGFASVKRIFDQDQFLGTPLDYTTSSDLKNVVLHAFSWLSFHYNKSSSNFVAEYTSQNVNGSLPNLDDGSTEEYGFSLRLFNDRLIFRANRYDTASIGQFGTGPINIPGAGSYLQSNELRWSIVHIEKTVLNTLGAAGIATANNPYSNFMNQVLNWTSNTNAGNGFGDYGQFHDRTAKGMEYTVTANPTRSWTLRASLAVNETRLSNIGSPWFDYINYRLATWKQVAAANPNLPLHIPQNPTTRTFQDYLSQSARTWQFINQAEGQVATQEAKYRARLTTAYAFNNGRLKGVRIGTSARYDSARTIGYRQIPIGTTSPYFDFTDPGVTIADQSQPLKGKALLLFDGFINYRRKIAGGLTWSINLNIRNLLDTDDLIPQESYVDADGSIRNVRFSLPEPRTFFLTNSLEF
jgi:hypothetical protein